MAKADARQCQDMVAKDTEVPWSGEKSRLRGSDICCSRFSGLLQTARKPLRCGSYRHFFRRIRSVRNSLVEKGRIEPPNPCLALKCRIYARFSGADSAETSVRGTGCSARIELVCVISGERPFIGGPRMSFETDLIVARHAEERL